MTNCPRCRQPLTDSEVIALYSSWRGSRPKPHNSASAENGKKGGRPKGSKNKPKQNAEHEQHVAKGSERELKKCCQTCVGSDAEYAMCAVCDPSDGLAGYVETTDPAKRKSLDAKFLRCKNKPKQNAE